MITISDKPPGGGGGGGGFQPEPFPQLANSRRPTIYGMHNIFQTALHDSLQLATGMARIGFCYASAGFHKGLRADDIVG